MAFGSIVGSPAMETKQLKGGVVIHQFLQNFGKKFKDQPEGLTCAFFDNYPTDYLKIYTLKTQEDVRSDPVMIFNYPEDIEFILQKYKIKMGLIRQISFDEEAKYLIPVARRVERINVQDYTQMRDVEFKDIENHVFYMCGPSTENTPVSQSESNTCKGSTNREHGCLYGKTLSSNDMLKINSYACILQNCFDRYCVPCGKFYLKQMKSTSEGLGKPIDTLDCERPPPMNLYIPYTSGMQHSLKAFDIDEKH